MLEKRRYAREHLDHLRTALMWEPRGHADMYGCLLTTAATTAAMCAFSQRGRSTAAPQVRE
jgi:proline racemase